MASNTERRITAKMILDSSGYNNSIKGINSSLKQVQSEFKLASEGLRSFGKDSDKLRAVQEALAKQVELHTKKVDTYKDAIEKTTAKMNDNIRERDRFKQSLEQANRKYEEAVRLYGRESEQAKQAKEEVERLEKEYKNKEKAVESNARQIQNYTTNMNNANTQLVRSQGELRRVSEELARSNNKWIGASENLKNASEKLKNVGSAVSGAGDKILKITAPLAAGGIASLKFATDFEDAVAKVSTIADESEVSIADLRKGILKLSSDTGIAATEIANNVYDAISAGQKTGDAINFVANSTKLAKAGFAEAGQSLDLLTTIMNAYGLEAKQVTKVSDVLINTQNLGKVTVGELSSSMGKVIPTAKAFGVNLEQVASGYAIMTAKGIKAAETTTYMASMFNELGKSGTKASDVVKKVSGKSFQELIASGKTVGEVLAMMDDYAKKNKLSLADLFGSAEAGKAALILSANAGKDFNEMLKSMNNTAGATDKAFDKVSNTTGERFRKSLNKLKNDAIELGDKVAPMLDKISDLISKLADKFGNLTDEQQQNIVKWGMIAIASGGALKVLGGGISIVGNVAGGLSKLTGWLGRATVATSAAGSAATGAAGAGTAGGLAGLSTALGGVIATAAPFIAGAAAIGAAAYGIHKHMSQEAIPSVDLFEKSVQKTTSTIKSANGQIITSYGETTIKISEETKKAIGSYMELDKGATASLTNMYANRVIITQGKGQELAGIYTNMNNQIKSGFDNHYTERISSLKNFFANSKAMSEKEEAEILNKEKWNNEQRKSSQEEFNQKIQVILQKASKEKRNLTAEEVKEINMYQEQMRNNAAESLSKEEIESKVILERLKGYSTRITAEQASEVIKNAENQRKQSVDKANKQYDETVKTIIKMRDETGSITAAQADKLIQEAERQKNQSIDKADMMKTGVINRIKDMNSDILKDIDETDGSIMTKWEKLKNWFANTPIVRWIKTVTSGDSEEEVGHNWTGTSYWRGGLTTLHERGYELYDLPKATRVYNHEASEDMVLKTAESVSEKVASRMLGNLQSNSNGVNVVQNIYSPTPSPSEVARQTKNSLRELALSW